MDSGTVAAPPTSADATAADQLVPVPATDRWPASCWWQQKKIPRLLAWILPNPAPRRLQALPAAAAGNADSVTVTMLAIGCGSLPSTAPGGGLGAANQRQPASVGYSLHPGHGGQRHSFHTSGCACCRLTRATSCDRMPSVIIFRLEAWRVLLLADNRQGQLAAAALLRCVGAIQEVDACAAASERTPLNIL
jgi:hypothetical protein